MESAPSPPDRFPDYATSLHDLENWGHKRFDIPLPDPFSKSSLYGKRKKGQETE
jgi:hypothetical protein